MKIDIFRCFSLFVSIRFIRNLLHGSYARYVVCTERTEILGRFSSPQKIKTLESGVSKYRE